MNNIFVGLIIAVIAGWFGYCLYRMWRGARGADCASCALGGDFDYCTYGREAVLEKPMEVVTSAGHHIIVDEEAARRRRERIRKMNGRKIVLWQFDLALEGKVPDLKF